MNKQDGKKQKKTETKSISNTIPPKSNGETSCSQREGSSCFLQYIHIGTHSQLREKYNPVLEERKQSM